MIQVTHSLVAEATLLGMGFDCLGGLYLAYDLLGGKHGPLSTIARATSYVVLFFCGYAAVLGLRYALVAAAGMGLLLAIEYHRAAVRSPENRSGRGNAISFGLLRGVVLGLAGMTIAGAKFGALFGLLSGLALTLINVLNFAPSNDYELNAKPRIRAHSLLASGFRALGISVAGVTAGMLTPSVSDGFRLGLRLGLAAGSVSALVGLLSPSIEWRVDQLPERRLGVFGLALILVGTVLQSAQYWIVVFNVPIR